MKIILNPDKPVVNKAKKAIRKEGGGFCPALLDQNVKFNCKHEPCIEFQTSDQLICPLGMYIKQEGESNE